MNKDFNAMIEDDLAHLQLRLVRASAPTQIRNRRIASILGIAGMAALITGCAAAARDPQWSDTQSDDQQAAAAPAVKAEPVKLAALTTTTADPVRGVITPQLEAVIASRMTAGITYMPYKVGQSFGQGAVLARFDCSITQAQYSAANAATAAYRKTYETNVELDQYQAVGKNEVAVSRANMGKAVAEAGAISAQLGQCAVYAPFSGTVVEQIAHVHEVAATGQPLMKVQTNNQLEVQLMAPSSWLTWLKPGVPFSFKIDETGQSVSGTVSRLGASVDPVSKTIRITGSIKRDGGMTILPGMSGAAIFDKQAANGTGA
jgi:membrane fusion protein, multidrug efflux system